MKNIRKIFAVLFFGLLSFGAVSESPYVFNEYKVYTGRLENFCKDAAVLLKLENTSQKVITSFDLYICVCDENGENPFEGSDTLVSELTARIEPGQNYNMAVSLDSFLKDGIEESLHVKKVYLRLVRFEDGSVWKDAHGIYGYGEELWP